MDKDLIIHVEGLGKKYVLGRNQSAGSYTALRDVLAEKFVAPWRSLRAGRGKARPPSGPDEFWALRDVNLQVRRGEVVGIIGRNGAGKSTLLKILSRITEPTTGRISLKGRVASLLEVGTGFHPELTGRENIFLNGAILGMGRAEIKAKFDEIVSFAEVERFLDTPVKRYSSGMYVRLAFAVAAHLEPEILIVDEVLAVGDAEFQKKCLGKMEDVAKSHGRTVLFVSHNMAAVQSLCTAGLILEKGRNTFYGLTKDLISHYSSSVTGPQTHSLLEGMQFRKGSGAIRCLSFRILTEDGREVESIMPNRAFTFEIGYRANRSVNRVFVSVDVDSSDNYRISSLYSGFKNQSFCFSQGEGFLRCHCEGLSLIPDTYVISILLSEGDEWADYAKSAATLTVSPVDFFGTGKLPKHHQGPLLTRYSWQA